jgi:hypothetical protein
MMAARADARDVWLRAFMALAFGAVVTALAYAALRVVEVVLFPRLNPAAIVSAERSALPWRIVVAAYVGGMGVIAGAAWVARDPTQAATWLGRAFVLAAVAVVVVGALWP